MQLIFLNVITCILLLLLDPANFVWSFINQKHRTISLNGSKMFA